MTNAKKKISVFFLTLVLAVGFSVSGVYASVSSILIDAQSGEVLSASNADELRYPASLTKLMTLYITFDALDKGLIKLDDKLKVSQNAANRSPSKLGVKAGTTIKVKDAIMALIIKSANDCATVLAENLGRSEQGFAITMTQVAKDLGMKKTTFKNASGLPNSLQKTTARDMAILGSAVYHHFPQYYDWFSAKSFKAEYDGKTYYSHNRLLKTFQGADGMKTGYTNAAGFNIVTSAHKNGNRVIAVTMGHKTVNERDNKIASLMNSGLQKLALNDSGIQYAARKGVATKKENIIVNASISSNESLAKSGNWAVQIGAFSNYSKARNYALEIQNELPRKFSEAKINVEPVSKDAAVIYRSQITGFAKNDAQIVCNSLKKSNKSCIVVEEQDTSFKLAQNGTHNSNQ